MSAAKITYLLSTCGKFSDVLFSTLQSDTVGMRKYMSLWLTLTEPSDGTFAVHSLDVHILHKKNNILAKAICSLNVSKSEKDAIVRATTIEPTGLICAFSLAKTYLKTMPYVFIPIILDYGRGSNMSHQAALIMEKHNTGMRVMFYEPYGLYNKYNKSYKQCICQLFSALGESITYHDMLRVSNGIQSIIMTQNNARYKTFNDEYADILRRLKEKNITPSREQEPDDKTVAILGAVSSAQRKLDPEIPDDTVLLNDIMNLYCRYNSKTCVAITLVELSTFFKNTSVIARRQSIEKLYNLFRVAHPNQVLMTELMRIIPPYIVKIVDQNKTTPVICEKLFEG